MKRAWLTVFGSGLLLVVFGLTALLGGSLWADPLRALQLLLFISGAVAFLAAGRNRTVAGLSPIQVVGAGDLALAVAVLLNVINTFSGGIPDESAETTAALGAAVGGIGLAFIGVDYLRGGRVFGVELTDEPLIER